MCGILYVVACHMWVSRFSETLSRFSVNSSAFHALGRKILLYRTWATYDGLLGPINLMTFFLPGWFRLYWMLWYGCSNHMRVIVCFYNAFTSFYMCKPHLGHHTDLQYFQSRSLGRPIVETYIYLIHFSWLYLYVVSIPQLLLSNNTLVLNHYSTNHKCCKRATMKKITSDGRNFTNFGYASLIFKLVGWYG